MGVKCKVGRWGNHAMIAAVDGSKEFFPEEYTMALGSQQRINAPGPLEMLINSH